MIAECSYVFGSGDVNCWIDPSFMICSLMLLMLAIGIEFGRGE